MSGPEAHSFPHHRQAGGVTAPKPRLRLGNDVLAFRSCSSVVTPIPRNSSPQSARRRCCTLPARRAGCCRAFELGCTVCLGALTATIEAGSPRLKRCHSSRAVGPRHVQVITYNVWQAIPTTLAGFQGERHRDIGQRCTWKRCHHVVHREPRCGNGKRRRACEHRTLLGALGLALAALSLLSAVLSRRWVFLADGFSSP
jgi:hypothetical protein